MVCFWTLQQGVYYEFQLAIKTSNRIFEDFLSVKTVGQLTSSLNYGTVFMQKHRNTALHNCTKINLGVKVSFQWRRAASPRSTMSWGTSPSIQEKLQGTFTKRQKKTNKEKKSQQGKKTKIQWNLTSETSESRRNCKVFFHENLSLQQQETKRQKGKKTKRKKTKPPKYQWAGTKF